MPCRGCGKNSGRAVGEIGEALPVAEEASRFQGSAPIGGHDSDRKSVGTTVGNRRPLRRRILWCVGEGLCPSRGRPQGSPLRRFDKKVPVRNPPATASPCQSPLGKGPRGRGMRIATGALRPRNDSVFARSRYKAGGRTEAFAPTGSFWFYLHRKIYISGAKEEYL